MEIDVQLGCRMRSRRRLLGLTQQDLAESIGVRCQQVSKWEIGFNQMTASRLFAVSQALEVPVSYFFAGLEDHQEAA